MSSELSISDATSRREVPYGLCHCGCGNPTRISPKSYPGGPKKGEPNRYIKGHQGKRTPFLYLEEDRGYATPCWIWQYALDSNGYPNYSTVRKTGKTYMFEQVLGEIPPERYVFSSCGEKLCVNPFHMRLVTSSERRKLAVTPKARSQPRAPTGEYISRNGSG